MKKLKKFFSVFDYREDDNVFYGTFLSGEYNRTRNFQDINNEDNKISIPPEQAEQIKFYFLIKIVDNNNALLLLSRFKTYGIKALFSKQLGKTIKNQIIPRVHRDFFNQVKHTLSLS